MKKKILFVAHERMINGSSRSMVNLIDYLSDKCKFVIVTPFKEGPFVDELNKRNVKIYYVPFYRWVDIKDKDFYKKKIKWKYYDSINEQLAIKFSEIIKKEKIDIIHSNTSVVDFGYRISKLLNIPHVWHIREFGEKDFSMYPLCSYYKYYKKIKDNNYLICISNEVSKKFINKVDKNMIRIIYNGVDKSNINKNKNYHLNKNEKIICLQSGMIHKAKGQDLTIKAIDKLNNEGYKIDLLIAGAGNIAELGVDISNKKWLKMLGQVNNLHEIRKNVDIEIVSSKSEAFGRVVVEAMMGSIPVIGSNSGAIKELIDDNNNGLLFESGNYISLYKKIKYLYENRSEIKRIGSNAYNDSHDYYVIDRCANEIYDFYNNILKEK